MDNVHFEQCKDLFVELELPQHKVCVDCEAETKNPLLPWHIGDSYGDSSDRLVFVGKPHRGIPAGALKLELGILDARKRAEELFAHTSWPYWRYTRDILKTVYGDATAGWQRIAMLNAVKCTSTEGSDKTSRQMATSCLSDVGVLGQELEILQPTIIVLYTWSFFKDLFEQPFPQSAKAKCTSVHTTWQHRVACGRKRLGWWHRTFETSWCPELQMLVVGHPERKKRKEYVSLVANWIQDHSRLGN